MITLGSKEGISGKIGPPSLHLGVTSSVGPHFPTSRWGTTGVPTETDPTGTKDVDLVRTRRKFRDESRGDLRSRCPDDTFGSGVSSSKSVSGLCPVDQVLSRLTVTTGERNG